MNKELRILCLTVLFAYKSITQSIAGLKLASHVLIIYKQNFTLIYIAKFSEIEFSTSFDGEGSMCILVKTNSHGTRATATKLFLG